MELLYSFGIVFGMAWDLENLFTQQPPPDIRCPNCRYVGKAKRYTKGNISIEIILWLCCILPGLIYTIWCMSSRFWGCPKCKFQYVAELTETELSRERSQMRQQESKIQKQELADWLKKNKM